MTLQISAAPRGRTATIFTLADVATMAIKKGMIEAILHEPAPERAPPFPT